jgi:hypothetical protein
MPLSSIRENKWTQEPYILEIKKIKYNNNNNLIKNGIQFKNEFSPLSGSELEYNPDKYNKNYLIKQTHNCYSYALGKIVKGLKSKAQPGYASGFSYIQNSDYDCQKFSRRLKQDNPMSYLESFDKSCVAGFYKIFLALDVKNDYHWWRHDNSGYWSHKPGASDVVDKDGSGEKIKNPFLSNRNFGRRNYYKPCFFACIQSDLSRALDTIYR